MFEVTPITWPPGDRSRHHRPVLCIFRVIDRRAVHQGARDRAGLDTPSAEVTLALAVRRTRLACRAGPLALPTADTGIRSPELPPSWGCDKLEEGAKRADNSAEWAVEDQGDKYDRCENNKTRG